MKVPVWFLASAQVPPEFAKVTVTVVPEVEPVAEQLVKPPVKAIVGVAGIVNAESKTALMVSPALSAAALVLAGLKPTVQVVWAYATCDAPEKETETNA